MSAITVSAMLGALVGFVGGSAFALWWFWQHIETAERTPGFRSARGRVRRP